MNTSNLSLTRRYVLALSFVAFLSITAFLTLRAAIAAQETSAAVVNVAGRQRMLSQRISRFALLLTLNKGTAEAAGLHKTMQDNVALFEASHNGLLKVEASPHFQRRSSCTARQSIRRSSTNVLWHSHEAG